MIENLNEQIMHYFYQNIVNLFYVISLIGFINPSEKATVNSFPNNKSDKHHVLRILNLLIIHSNILKYKIKREGVVFITAYYFIRLSLFEAEF